MIQGLTKLTGIKKGNCLHHRQYTHKVSFILDNNYFYLKKRCKLVCLMLSQVVLCHSIIKLAMKQKCQGSCIGLAKHTNLWNGEHSLDVWFKRNNSEEE